MIAVISDVHSNLAALKAVLKNIEQVGCDEIVCLGDIVGYGPSPNECVDLIRKCTMHIMGNHDEAVLKGGEKFNVRAKQAIDWTREVLSPVNKTFLNSIPTIQKRNGLTFVHGSPRNHTTEYIFPQDVGKPDKLREVFSLIDRICFFGHTHYPGIFLDNIDFLTSEEIGGIYMLDNQKILVNVGSVGQPRDEDSRSCYVTFDGDTVVFRRVEYDINDTLRRIYEIPQLDNFLGERLLVGK